MEDVHVSRPQAADVAEVVAELLAAGRVGAGGGNGLHSAAVHAHHLFCGVSVDGVVAGLVVAEAAGVDSAAAGSHKLAVSLVVLAAEGGFSVVGVCGLVLSGVVVGGQ